MANSTLVHNSRSRILLEIGIVVQYRWQFSCHFTSFSGKIYDKIFQKMEQTLIWSHFTLYLPKFWRRWIFREKKGSASFYYCTKNQKKLLTHSWEKCRTDSFTENWQFNSPSLPLIVGIELIPESLSIFNPGIFFTLFPFLKAVQEDVKSRANLTLLFFINLTKNLLQQFGILKLVTLSILATRVISIFNLCYLRELNTWTSSVGETRKSVKQMVGNVTCW